MKINGNEIRPGNILEHNGGLWRAVKTESVKPGKGGAYAQVELKNIRDGSKLNQRFRASESVEKVRLDDGEFQFLYADGEDFTFMNQTTFDQINLGNDIIGEASEYLQDGMVVTLSSYEGEVLSITLPDTVVLEIVESEPVVKGQTAASSFKPAVLENGVRVMVPPHIETGTKVVVNTADSTYVERAKD
ncbi:MAG: elongation factor P [Alphaproteobacteria bacterium]